MTDDALRCISIFPLSLVNLQEFLWCQKDIEYVDTEDQLFIPINHLKIPFFSLQVLMVKFVKISRRSKTYVIKKIK